MKTLSESINEVMSSRGSRKSKAESLVKLGLRPFDIQMIFDLNRKTKKTNEYGLEFDANKLTFGVEIECYNITRENLISSCTDKQIDIRSEHYNHDNNKKYFKLVSDASIRGYNGVECVSPILKGKTGENALKKVCDSLNECNAQVNKTTGLHIHIGAKNLPEDVICRVVRNYQKLESAIDKIMPKSRRGNNNMYCRGMAGINLEGINSLEAMRREFSYSRYYKINLEAYSRHRTIEFRQHSGTTDYKKISMWLMFVRDLINYSYYNELVQINSSLYEYECLSPEFREYAKERQSYFENREGE